MILILSKHGDPSTSKVMDWIESYGGNCLRINSEDLYTDDRFLYSISDKGVTLSVNDSGSPKEYQNFDAVWFRTHGGLAFAGNFHADDEALQKKVRTHAHTE